MAADDTDIDIEDIYDEYIDKGNLDESITRINVLLESNEGNRHLLLDAKAEALNQMGKLDDAVKIYKQLLDEDESYTNAYVALATIYQLKEFDEDVSYSQEIIELYKALEKINAEKVSYYVLAGALRDKGDFDDALRYYEKAIEQEIEDNYFLENIHKDRARILVTQKKFTEALDAYDQAMDCSVTEYGDDSHCSEIYAYKRDIYEQMKNWDSVREMDEKFMSSEKKYADVEKLSADEFHDERLGGIHAKLEGLGEQEEKTTNELSRLVLLIIQERYQEIEISYIKLVEIIEEVLEEVEYDKEIRPIEKARLISSLSSIALNKQAY